MPKSFTDTQGASWPIEITVSTIKRVRSLIDIDLLEVLDGKLIDQLVSDPVLLCDVLYAVCKPEADRRALSDEQFGSLLAGDAIDQATDALLTAIVSFSPSPRDRAALGQVLTKARAAMDRARDVIDDRIKSGEVDRAIDAAIAPILKPPARKPKATPKKRGRSRGDARGSPA